MAPTIRPIRSHRHDRKYAVDFFGDELIVTVTTCPSEISRWIYNVVSYHNDHHSSHHPLVVGVGVQWTPDSSDSSFQVDTLQLCVGKRCLIIQLSHCDRVPNDLRHFLVDQETIFVGVWNSQDARKLAESWHQLWIGELLDIRKFVEDSEGRSMRCCSFEEIVEECMGYQGVRLDPEISMSYWGAYELRLDQILQASIEAYVCFDLGVWVRLWEV